VFEHSMINNNGLTIKTNAEYFCSSMPADTGKIGDCFAMCPRASVVGHNANDSVTVTAHKWWLML